MPKRFTSRRNTISAIGQLAINVVALVIVFFSYRQTGNAVENATLLAIFFLFAATFITDKVGGVFAGYSFDSDHAETKRIFDELPALLVGGHDIVTFPTRVEALRYATYLISSATHVKNTVLRYGEPNSSTQQDHAYVLMLEAKRKSIMENDCAWTEVISSRLSDADPVIQIIKDLQPKTRYHVHYIDDTVLPMVQMFIFDFSALGREVVFGRDFPGAEHGAAFATRNPRIIEYFEKYFMHCYRLGSETRASSANVPLSASLPSSTVAQVVQLPTASAAAQVDNPAGQ